MEHRKDYIHILSLVFIIIAVTIAGFIYIVKPNNVMKNAIKNKIDADYQTFAREVRMANDTLAKDKVRKDDIVKLACNYQLGRKSYRSLQRLSRDYHYHYNIGRILDICKLLEDQSINVSRIPLDTVLAESGKTAKDLFKLITGLYVQNCDKIDKSGKPFLKFIKSGKYHLAGRIEDRILREFIVCVSLNAPHFLLEYAEVETIFDDFKEIEPFIEKIRYRRYNQDLSSDNKKE